MNWTEGSTLSSAMPEAIDWMMSTPSRADQVEPRPPNALVPPMTAAAMALISSLIETRYGRRIACIQQEVNAISLPKALSEPLHAEAGSPALKIVRRYLDSADVPFEISVSVHPADRFTFSMQMSRTREPAAS